MAETENKTTEPKPKLTDLLKPYYWLIVGLLVFALFSNALTLVIPKIIQKGIDDFGKGGFNINVIAIQFVVASLAIFILLYLQGIIQTYASEKVARDLRKKLSAKISQQSYITVQETTPKKLLTNLTSDVDSIKMFISQAIASIVSSIVLIFGASILLLSINLEAGVNCADDHPGDRRNIYVHV